MTQKRNPDLKVVEQQDFPEEAGKSWRILAGWRKWALAGIFLVFLVLTSSYLILSSQSYTSVYRAASYKKETSDSNRYAAFDKGIVRYSRDGVALLNKKNEELWIQPSQFSNPVIDISRYAFAVGDSGGNTIQVFTSRGMKGEIETTLPIERFSVSDQGIVSVILKNEMSPQIVTYDAVGNILVENEVSVGNLGYPTALDMSSDGKTLMVSYLCTSGGILGTKLVYYDFGKTGNKKANHQVSAEEFADSVIPEVFFMDSLVSVAISDHSFVIYEGKETPKKKREVEIGQEIRSIFHTKKYIGFVLLNPEKSGYEVRLYDRSGEQVMNRTLDGEYRNVQMAGNEIILYDGSKCCIVTEKGVQRFKGSLDTDVLEIVPVNGLNKYLVMSANELQVIYLTK